MKILVNGANEYIGSKVVKTLCDANIFVIATDFNNIDSRAKFVQADIFSDKDNWFSFFDNPDICLHLAWRDGFLHNSDRHIYDLPFHYKFLINLINNELKFISCMGTMHEIGYYEGAVFENTPCNPLSKYGIAKNSLRQLLDIYCNEKKIKFQWLRAYYIYGNDLVGNSIFCKIRQAVQEGKKFFPFTSGKNMYDFIHKDKLANQITKCVMQDEVLGIINACSGKPQPLATKIEDYILQNDLPIKLDYGKYPERTYDLPCIFGYNTKITLKRKELL